MHCAFVFAVQLQLHAQLVVPLTLDVPGPKQSAVALQTLHGTMFDAATVTRAARYCAVVVMTPPLTLLHFATRRLVASKVSDVVVNSSDPAAWMPTSATLLLELSAISES